jgi:hypothetical protein
MLEFARESLVQVFSQRLELLMRAHWLEIAHFKDIPLSPDWDAYAMAEEAGKLRCYTARFAGELIGYAAYFVNRNPHYKTSLQAVQDVLFLVPEHRKRTVGLKFVAWCDRQLAAEGVQAVYHHSKIAMPMDPLLKRLGYELIDTLWAKRLDKVN